MLLLRQRLLRHQAAAPRLAAPAGSTRPGRAVRTPAQARAVRRARAGPEDLLRAQLAVFGPIAAALEDRTWTTKGFEHILTLSRHKEMQATILFLQDELTPGKEPTRRSPVSPIRTCQHPDRLLVCPRLLRRRRILASGCRV